MAAGCVVCASTETTLLRCERCLSRVYCGPLCQKKDWQTHKAKCRRPNYILRVDLFPRQIKNPQITRTISCPAGATFATFHKAIQIAFGWKNISTYDFDVFDDASRCPAIPTSGDDNAGYDRKHRDPIYKLIEPKAIGDSDIGLPTLDSSRYSLFEVLDNPNAIGKIFCYNYYHIAGEWKHEIICLGRTDATDRFFCIDGEGHSCTEDVGGYEGWNQLREAYGEKSPSWYQRTIMAWFETNAINKDPGGLGGEAKWKWDKEMINEGSNNLRPELNKCPENMTAPWTEPRSVLTISFSKELSDSNEPCLPVLAMVGGKTSAMPVLQMINYVQDLLQSKEYTPIVVSDGAITGKRYIALQQELTNYARSGGTVILWFQRNLPRKVELDRFFREVWRLNWTCGDSIHTSMFSLNPRVSPDLMKPTICGTKLRHQYSMTALQLSGSRFDDQVYTSSSPSILSSKQSPAIFANYGFGNVGWIGDVNNELGTQELVFSMSNTR